MRTFFLIYGLRWFTWLSWHFILICILTPLHTKWRHGPLSFPSFLFTTAIYVMWQKKWQLTISKSILFNLSHRKTFVQQNNSCHFCINGTITASGLHQWGSSLWCNMAEKMKTNRFRNLFCSIFHTEKLLSASYDSKVLLLIVLSSYSQ